MKDKVLIDTSVWINFFRNKDTDLIEKIATLLKSKSVVYTGLVAVELLNGAKNEKELQTLYDLFKIIEKVNECDLTHFNAGMMGYKIAKNGYTLNTADLLIAQIAIENSLAIMTFDEHFKTIEKYSRLKLF